VVVVAGGENSGDLLVFLTDAFLAGAFLAGAFFLGGCSLCFF